MYLSRHFIHKDIFERFPPMYDTITLITFEKLIELTWNNPKGKDNCEEIKFQAGNVFFRTPHTSNKLKTHVTNFYLKMPIGVLKRDFLDFPSSP